MSRVRAKTIRLEHERGSLIDRSVKGKKVDHIRFSQAERSIVYVTVVFVDRAEWSISIEPFSLPTARVSHFVSIEDAPIAESGQMLVIGEGSGGTRLAESRAIRECCRQWQYARCLIHSTESLSDRHSGTRRPHATAHCSARTRGQMPRALAS